MANSKTDPTPGETSGNAATTAVTEAPVVTASAVSTPEIASGPELGAPVERPPLKELEGVRYTGTADKRIFSALDFAKAGIDGIEEDLVFDRDNGFRVPKKGLSAAAVDFILTQPNFDIY